MQTNNRQHIGTRTLYLVGLVIGLLALAACQPIRDPAIIAAEATAAAAGAPADTVEEEPAVAPAMATISAESLRVRAEPNDDAEVVAGARQGESYDVIGISSDGAWIQIEIDRSPSGTGWVSASFVTLEGDITNIETVDIATSGPAATPEATEEPAEEATPAPTEEPVEEATVEPTEEPAEEMTPEATEEPVEEATPEPTEEPAEEATPEPTAEPVEEATPEATEEPVEEATPAPTEEPVEEATPEPTEEVADIGLGTVTIVTDLPLRVRSAPTTDEDNKIGNVFDGDVYTVLEISEDGMWIRIDVPELGVEDGGWVSAEYVVFNEAG